MEDGIKRWIERDGTLLTSRKLAAVALNPLLAKIEFDNPCLPKMSLEAKRNIETVLQYEFEKMLNNEAAPFFPKLNKISDKIAKDFMEIISGT